MNIGSTTNFVLAALNIGVMIWAMNCESWGWVFSLAAAVYCFYMGLQCLDL